MMTQEMTILLDAGRSRSARIHRDDQIGLPVHRMKPNLVRTFSHLSMSAGVSSIDRDPEHARSEHSSLSLHHRSRSPTLITDPRSRSRHADVYMMSLSGAKPRLDGHKIRWHRPPLQSPQLSPLPPPSHSSITASIPSSGVKQVPSRLPTTSRTSPGDAQA
jgi:hypothetical protein